MRHARVLIALLLLATVLVDCAILGSVATMTKGMPPDWVIDVVLALALSQVSLAGIWAGLGKKSTPWRLAAAVLLPVLWSRALQKVTRENAVAAWLALTLTPALLVVAVLFIARRVGVRLVRGAEGARIETSGQGLQFSLRDLFAWTTATAVVLGIAKWLTPWESLWLPEGLSRIMLVSISTTAIPFSALWTALGRKRLSARMISLLAIPAGLVLLVFGRPYFCSYAPTTRDLVDFPLFFAVETFLLLGSLWVFRVAGYRLTWIRRPYDFNESTPAKDPK